MLSSWQCCYSETGSPLYIIGQPWTCYVAQATLKLMVVLPLPLLCSFLNFTLLASLYSISPFFSCRIRIAPRISHMLSKCCTQIHPQPSSFLFFIFRQGLIKLLMLDDNNSSPPPTPTSPCVGGWGVGWGRVGWGGRQGSAHCPCRSVNYLQWPGAFNCWAMSVQKLVFCLKSVSMNVWTHCPFKSTFPLAWATDWTKQ